MEIEEMNRLWERVAPRLEPNPSFTPEPLNKTSVGPVGEHPAVRTKKSPVTGLELILLVLQLMILTENR